MKVIGLTGGIAVGKSVATDHLSKKFNIPIIDADAITHQLLTPDNPVYHQMIKLFGKDILTKDGTINRNAIADKIFSDSKLRQKYEKLIHPLILTEIDCEVAKYRAQDIARVIVSATLILELNLQKRFDLLIVILSKPEIQIERLTNVRGLSRQQAQQRLDAQWTNEQRLKVKGAQLIWNNNSKEHFESQLAKLF